ncbi:MAG: serine protease [Patescibacteria group bacterium]|nr:serine protease [Patescibacteria group bacterium]
MIRSIILVLLFIAILTISASIFSNLIKNNHAEIINPYPPHILIKSSSTPINPSIDYKKESRADLSTSTGISSDQIVKIPDITKLNLPIITPVPKPTSTLPQIKPILPAKQISPTSIVGLVCYFNYNYVDANTGVIEKGTIALSRGSGVIITKNGHILTNRHVIERRSSKQIAIINNQEKEINVYDINYCEVGIVPKETTLPTPDLIRKINPIVRVSVLGYVAKLAYEPNLTNLSAIEAENLDFAILKITGLSEAGPIFGVTSLPASFDYAEMLSNAILEKNDEVITYGFPGDVTEGTKSVWTTIYLTGSVGKYTGFFVGDKFFRETPLVLDTEMEVYAGRSGSPLFWRGFLVGIVRSYDIGNRLNSHAVAMDAIQKIMGSELDNLKH